MAYDFLIIGGGIAGVSAAARLAALGSTILIEAEDHFAYHASGRSAALYEPNYGAPTVVNLSKAGAIYFSDAGVLSSRGILMLGRPGEEEALARDAASFAMEQISPEEALEKAEFIDASLITRAAFSNGAKDIDTDALVRHFWRVAASQGAVARHAAPVRKITRQRSKWEVTAGAESHRAKTIINAAGAWADQIAALAQVPALGLTPLRRSVARVPAPKGLDPSRWPMLFGPGESWYAKPDAGQLIVSPADETQSEPCDAAPTELALAEGIDQFARTTGYQPRRITARWAGLRTFAPDRTLVIGRDPGQPDFFWLAGQGGYGFQTSAGASALAADLIAGRDPDLPKATVKALAPDRLR
ncbi:MAG: FAD-binding oxidoreductase [Pseudomonadota bacterium]